MKVDVSDLKEKSEMFDGLFPNFFLCLLREIWNLPQRNFIYQ